MLPYQIVERKRWKNKTTAPTVNHLLATDRLMHPSPNFILNWLVSMGFNLYRVNMLMVFAKVMNIDYMCHVSGINMHTQL